MVNLAELRQAQAMDTVMTRKPTDTDYSHSSRVDCELAKCENVVDGNLVVVDSYCIVICRRSRVQRQSSCTENLVGSVAEAIAGDVPPKYSLGFRSVYGLPLRLALDHLGGHQSLQLPQRTERLAYAACIRLGRALLHGLVTHQVSLVAFNLLLSSTFGLNPSSTPNI